VEREFTAVLAIPVSRYLVITSEN